MRQASVAATSATSLIAAGIGSLVLGLMVVLAEASADIKNALDFARNYGLGSGVGPLSGKVLVATIAFLLGWVILHLLLRKQEVSFGVAFIVALVLVGAGFLLTFPPVFLAFEA